jgi:hypothetical protein
MLPGLAIDDELDGFPEGNVDIDGRDGNPAVWLLPLCLRP